MLSLAGTLIASAGLALVLALGAANPPRAAHLVLNLRSADDLAPAGTLGDVRLFAFPVDDLTSPFTVELEASASGSPSSAWGIWLRVSDHSGNLRDLPMLIDNQGYVVAALTSPTLQHQQFIHVQPGSNHLYVHVEKNDTAVFRINDEIFASVPLPATSVQAVGLALSGELQVNWKSIKIYTSG